MNYRLISKNLGVMLLLLAGAMGVCLGVSYMLVAGEGRIPEPHHAGWQLSVTITGLSAFALLYYGKKASNKGMLRKDAIGLVGIGWLSCSLFGALPYLFCDPQLSVSASLFESISGLTTTGATVFADLDTVPKSVLLWRSATQWMGGMGILAMFVLFLAGSGASSRSLFRTESSMHANEFIGITMRQTARRLWLLYMAFTAICAIGLWALGMTPFQAFNHAMTTVATGGFGTENSSIAAFGVPVRIWIICFMFIGGISFPLYLSLLGKNRWKALKSHEETWVFTGIIIVSCLAITGFRSVSDSQGGLGFEEGVNVVFNTVSVATSTGYSSSDYDLWPIEATGALLILMAIGGCAGSTTGGLKVSRAILLVKFVRIEIQRVFRPNLVVNLKINGRAVPGGTQGQLLVVLTSALAAGAAGCFLLTALEPDISVNGCVSAVLASLSNLGPAYAEFGPSKTFASLSPPSMVLLSGLMILGRLEYIAVLVLLSRRLWRSY